MAPHDGHGTEAGGDGRFDELLVLQRQCLAAHDARHVHPGDQADADEQQFDVATEGDQQQDQEEHIGNGHHDVDEAHHQVVQPATEVAGDGAVQRADDDGDEGADDADHQRDLAAQSNAGKKVAAFVVGAEVVAGFNGGPPGDGGVADGAPVDFLVTPLGEQRADEGEQEDRQQH